MRELNLQRKMNHELGKVENKSIILGDCHHLDSIV